jgi:DNA-binding HxlR family transcriptional regulator
MKIDTERCPVDQAIELVGGKWKSLILWRLSAGTLRFGQLQRAIPQVTQRMLTLQLRELESAGLVQRTVYPDVPPKVEYALTGLGRSVVPVLESLGRWVQDHTSELLAVSAAKAQGHETSPEQISIRSPASRVRH